jgi:hypothetical protein
MRVTIMEDGQSITFLDFFVLVISSLVMNKRKEKCVNVWFVKTGIMTLVFLRYIFLYEINYHLCIY